VPDPEILPDPDGDTPPQPPELPGPDQDIPELPNRPDPLGNDLVDGRDGFDIGPQ
jgi:hypothetical protein